METNNDKINNNDCIYYGYNWNLYTTVALNVWVRMCCALLLLCFTLFCLCLTVISLLFVHAGDSPTISWPAQSHQNSASWLDWLNCKVLSSSDDTNHIASHSFKLAFVVVLQRWWSTHWERDDSWLDDKWMRNAWEIDTEGMRSWWNRCGTSYE